MSKWQLFNAMVNHTLVSLLNAERKETTGYVEGITREDGSGRCFNVVLRCENFFKTVFVRTID